MDIETYGGTCPLCSSAMLQKFDIGGTCFSFDACPYCGFAYGETPERVILTGNDIWQEVLRHHGVATLGDLRDRVRRWKPDAEARKPSVFSYGESREKLASYCWRTIAS